MDSLCARAKATHNAARLLGDAGGDWTTGGYRAGHASELNRPLPLKETENNVCIYRIVTLTRARFASSCGCLVETVPLIGDDVMCMSGAHY